VLCGGGGGDDVKCGDKKEYVEIVKRMIVLNRMSGE
jgi:hypothetical protein